MYNILMFFFFHRFEPSQIILFLFYFSISFCTFGLRRFWTFSIKHSLIKLKLTNHIFIVLFFYKYMFRVLKFFIVHNFIIKTNVTSYFSKIKIIIFAYLFISVNDLLNIFFFFFEYEIIKPLK